MLDPNIKDKEGLPLTCRAVFIVGPDKKLKLSLNYPASVGRNMDEIVRVIDALQLSAKYSVVRGQHCISLAHCLQPPPFPCPTVLSLLDIAVLLLSACSSTLHGPGCLAAFECLCTLPGDASQLAQQPRVH